MNQEKIGKFIASCRKEQKLTQEQLAEKLNITYKAVSKWETGKGLPDPSIMLELCNILKINVNELLSGEKLQDKEIIKQSEKNILDIIRLSKNKTRNYKIAICLILIVLFCFVTRFAFIKLGYAIDNNLKYTQVYISGESNVKGNVDINKFSKKNINFDIGANKYGVAVFKDPDKAFKTLKKEYSKGIKLIQKEYNLLPLTNFNFRQYKTYGWQVTSGTEEEQEQARFVTSFMDIYENSFN